MCTVEDSWLVVVVVCEVPCRRQQIITVSVVMPVLAICLHGMDSEHVKVTCSLSMP